MGSRLLRSSQRSRQTSPGDLPVGMLRAIFGRGDDGAGRQMGESDAGVGLVAMLTTWPRGTECVDPDIAAVQPNSVLKNFVSQRDDGDGRTVPSALLVVCRHPLDAVGACKDG